jgi:aryl-alcohol dehydrogenase-like predicted oxidoreductase
MLTGKYRRGEKGRAEALGGKVFRAENSSENSSALDTVLAIAEELHVTPDQVAIAWVASRGPLPIIGPRTMAQLASNLGAKDLPLTKGHLDRLNAASEPPRGDVTKAAVSLDDPATERPLVPVA